MIIELRNKSNDNAVENIKSRFPELQCKAIDACKIPLNDSSIDLVISIEVVEHLLHPEKHFKEVKRILKPGGQYIIRTPNKIIERLYYKCIGRYDIVIWHPSSFTPYRLKKQLKQLNFDIKFLSINSLPVSQLNKIPCFLRSGIKKISLKWIPLFCRPSLICIANVVD